MLASSSSSLVLGLAYFLRHCRRGARKLGTYTVPKRRKQADKNCTVCPSSFGRVHGHAVWSGFQVTVLVVLLKQKGLANMPRCADIFVFCILCADTLQGPLGIIARRESYNTIKIHLNVWRAEHIIFMLPMNYPVTKSLDARSSLPASMRR